MEFAENLIAGAESRIKLYSGYIEEEEERVLLDNLMREVSVSGRIGARGVTQLV